jgi:hypothetical protein
VKVTVFTRATIRFFLGDLTTFCHVEIGGKSGALRLRPTVLRCKSRAAQALREIRSRGEDGEPRVAQHLQDEFRWMADSQFTCSTITAEGDTLSA